MGNPKEKLQGIDYVARPKNEADESKMIMPSRLKKTLEIKKDSKTGAMLYKMGGKWMTLNQFKYAMQEGALPKVNLSARHLMGQDSSDKRSQVTGHTITKGK